MNGGCICVPSSPRSIPSANSFRTAHTERTAGFGDTVLGSRRGAPAIRRPARGSVPVRRSSSRRPFSASSVRTPGRSALMSAPRCWASTSSPTDSCSMVQGRRRRHENEPDERCLQLHLLVRTTDGPSARSRAFRWIGKRPPMKRVAFSIGPQVGQVCGCGGIPTLVQMQVQYYAGPSQRWRSEVGYSTPADPDDPCPDQQRSSS